MKYKVFKYLVLFWVLYWVLILFYWNIFIQNNVFWDNWNLIIYWENFSWKILEEKSLIIKVKNFSWVAGLQIFLEYNKNVLEFKEVLEKKFSWTDNFSEWRINFLWDDFVNPKNFTDDEKILELKFKILWSGLEDNLESEIRFSSDTKFFDINW